MPRPRRHPPMTRRPPTPPPESPPGSKAWVGLLAVILVLLILLGGLAWGAVYLYDVLQSSAEEDQPVAEDVTPAGDDRQEDDGSEPLVVTEPDAPETRPTDPSPVSATATNGAAAPPDARSDGTDEEPAGTMSADVPPHPLPSSAETTTVGTADAGADGSGTAEPDPAEPTEPAEPIWPIISVDGFVGNAKSGMAILSGEMVPVGEFIQDVQLRAIRGQYVCLRYKGEDRWVRKGTSTQ